MHTSDTIAAIATPPGLGGVAVLRISGPQARAILRSLFAPLGGSADKPFAFRPRYMHYGHLLDSEGAVIDAVLAVFMPGPHSYTGEDVAEIHCHGGMGVSAAALEAILAAGARLAERGEFTRRAYLNGRLDISQAEAVAELINAPSRQGIRLAAAKLDGALSRQIDAMRRSLDAMRAQVILAVDFPDEEAELLSIPDFSRTVGEARQAVHSLLQAFERARLWREGALAVLAGRVNAGKSSLLNALLGRERAIVSPTPGTTRDYIEESVNLRGLPLRLVDTAGLREGGDLVEAEGIRRSRDLAEDADALICVIAVDEALLPEEREFVRKHLGRSDRAFIVALNKVDLLPEAAERLRAASPGEMAAVGRALGRELLADLWGSEPLPECACYALSADQGLGLDALADGLRLALAQSAADSDSGGGDIAPNLRQSQLLRQTLPELDSLAEALRAGHPPDILGVHLEAAMQLLAEVSGVTDNEALLDRIFSEFCIGK